MPYTAARYQQVANLETPWKSACWRNGPWRLISSLCKTLGATAGVLQLCSQIVRFPSDVYSRVALGRSSFEIHWTLCWTGTEAGLHGYLPIYPTMKRNHSVTSQRVTPFE